MPEVERLIEWLPRTAARADAHLDRPRRLPHRQHDLRAATEPRVIAVLDWELSTLGDPLADFSYFLMSWVTEPEGRSGVHGHDRAGDAASRRSRRWSSAIARATGRDGVPDLNWYFAYNLFRLTGIVQGIKKRIVDGTASSAQAEETARACRLAMRLGFARRRGREHVLARRGGA